MAKYLVGTGKNTWQFYDAINAASDGDILEFERNFIHEIPADRFFEFNKDLTIIGQVDHDNEQNIFNNKIIGKLQIAEGKVVHFQNIWLRTDAETNAVSLRPKSKATFEFVVLESTFLGENYPLLFASSDTEVSMHHVWTLAKSSGTIKSIGKSLTIINSILKTSINLSHGVMGTINNTTIDYFMGNALNIQDASLVIEACQVSGGDKEKDFPVVYLSNASLTSSRCVFSQIDYAYAVNLNTNSFLSSSHDVMTSLKLASSRARLDNLALKLFLQVSNTSFAFISSTLYFLGENKKIIDALISDDSVLTGNQINFSRISLPNMLIKAQSLCHLKHIAYQDGQASDINIEVDASSIAMYPEKIGTTKTLAESSETEKLASREALENLVGLTSVKSEIRKMLGMVDFNKQRIAQGLKPEKQSLHAVFMGNPGTGKTTVARLMGKVLFENGVFSSDQFKFIEVTESDLISNHVGETAIQTQALLEKAKGGILFIDEAYTLNKRESNVNFGQEAINTILKYMEDHRDEIMIIFAGYTKEMGQFLKINPGLASRVPNKFIFEDYTGDEIVKMGESLLTQKQYRLEDISYYEAHVKRVYQTALERSNGRWIRNLNEKILKSLANRVMTEGSTDVSTVKNIDIDNVLNESKYTADASINQHDALEAINQLIGIPKVKAQVAQFIALADINQKREAQGHIGSNFTLHTLFLGNPGTGKTTVARLLGEVMYQKGIINQRKFIEVSRSDLVAGYVGQTAIKTREVLESALGGVLFIDEAYTLSSGMGNDFGQEAIDEILKFMENHRRDIVIIFAGYTKEMRQFVDANSGLASRIPNAFYFEDYTIDELIKIGLRRLHQMGYQLPTEQYAKVIACLYADGTNNTAYNNSNGRWIRNLNERLIMIQSTRLSNDGSGDLNLITDADLQQLLVFEN